MRLDIDEVTHSVTVTLDDRAIASSEEVRPGVIVQYDCVGEIVGVAINRSRNGHGSSEGDTAENEPLDPIANYQPRTALGALLIETRRKLHEDGIPFLTQEEFEREVAERRGGIRVVDCSCSRASA